MAGKKTLATLLVLAVAALTAGGCSSDSDSNPTRVDTAPPAVPTDLDYALADGAVTVSWAPNTTDSDFAGYILARTCNGMTVQLVTTPQAGTSYVDQSPQPGVNVYAVASVDQRGNESAFATIGVAIQNHHIPAQPNH